MQSIPRFRPLQAVPRFVSKALGLMAFAFAAFAVPNLAIGQFASTKFNPNSQTANVGTNFSVDVVLTDPAGSHALNGVEVWINFNAALLQAVSVTTGGASPFTNVSINQIDNAS